MLPLISSCFTLFLKQWLILIIRDTLCDKIKFYDYWLQLHFKEPIKKVCPQTEPTLVGQGNTPLLSFFFFLFFLIMETF